MARGRMLNRRVSTARKMDELWESEGAEGALVWTWMLPWVDINGNVRADPLWVWANVCPLAGSRGAISVEKVASIIDTVHRLRLGFKYEVDGVLYLHLPSFLKHQKGVRKDRELAEYPNVPRGMRTKWLRYQDAEEPETVVETRIAGQAINGIVALPRLLSGEVDDDGWLDDHPPKNEVLGWWIDGLRILGHDRPPGAAIHRMGKVAERLGESYSRRQIARAIVGLGQLYPWCPTSVDPKSPNRPWDLMTLEKHFGTASLARLPHEERSRLREEFTDL